MPIDNDSPRPPPHGSPPAKSSEAQEAGQLQGPQKGGRKQVRFSAQDEVATYVKGVGRKGHGVPQAVPAKGPAPSTPPHARDVGCRILSGHDGALQVFWPSGQRYDGPLDGYRAPHGVGTVTLSDGGTLANARWSHGVCVAVGDDKALALQVEAFRPPSRRPQPAHVPAQMPAQAQAPQADAPPQKPGLGNKLFGQLRQLTKSRDKGRP